MTFFPQAILDEIRDSISIVSYIGECVPLKKTGRNHKGQCPFHAEKTPSFMVNDEKEIFHCFGCGEGGNIFSFVMKYEGLSFPEAVEHLAARAGVTLPKKQLANEELNKIELAQKKKKLLLRVNEITAEFFLNNLKNSPPDSHVCNYLKNRGIFNENITQHFLGFAEDSWSALYCYLKDKNVPLQLAEELGLIKRRESNGEYYDFFRDRLIFPIISNRNEVIGFGGRIISGDDKDIAKYLNSPDSMIYHKSHSVYGLNVASNSIRQCDQVVIVEGYMDALSLNQAGIMNVVAPLGTALTTGHIKLLMRYSKNMILIFDGDSAGIKAAERSLPNFLEAQVMPKVVTLPDGMDPDDWIRKNDKAGFEDMIKRSSSLFEWYIKRRVVGCGTDVTKRSGIIAELKPFFARIDSLVEFSYFRKLLSDELKIDESDLTRQFDYGGSSSSRQLKIGGEGAAGRLRSERLLLTLMLAYPDLIYRVKSSVEPEFFTDGSFRTLFELVIKESQDEKFSVGRLLDNVADEELKATIHSLSASDDIDEENSVFVLEDCIKYFVKSRLYDRLKMITDEIKIAENSKDDEKVLNLIAEKNKLLAQSS